MLTATEKEVIRLIIAETPDPAYMQKLGASDTFAKAEIQRVVPGMIEFRKNVVRTLVTLQKALDAR